MKPCQTPSQKPGVSGVCATVSAACRAQALSSSKVPERAASRAPARPEGICAKRRALLRNRLPFPIILGANPFRRRASMFEKWRIKEHMDVADCDGRHVGTVDEIEDNRIKLTRSDSADGSHHYVDIDSVDRI